MANGSRPNTHFGMDAYEWAKISSLDGPDNATYAETDRLLYGMWCMHRELPHKPRDSRLFTETNNKAGLERS